MKAFASLIAVAMLMTPQATSWAAPLYKCEIDGALAFQDTPCPPIKAKQKIACKRMADLAWVNPDGGVAMRLLRWLKSKI